MFEEFSKRKCAEYLKHVEFSNNEIYFKDVKQSNFPPYITNFFDCSLKRKKIAINKRYRRKDNKSIIIRKSIMIEKSITIAKPIFIRKLTAVEKPMIIGF